MSRRPHLGARVNLDRTIREIECLETSLRVLVPEVPAGDRLAGADARDAAIRGTPQRLRAELQRLRSALRDKAEEEIGEGEGREIYFGPRP